MRLDNSNTHIGLETTQQRQMSKLLDKFYAGHL